MTTTHTHGDTRSRERDVYRAIFKSDAEYAHRTDRMLWRAECRALALLIGAEEES